MKTLGHGHRHHRGFTIVELAVAISIILLLVLVVIPRIAHVRDDAQKDTLHANVNLLQGAYERAKLQDPAVISNNLCDVWTFCQKAQSKGFINRGLTAVEVTRIGVAPGTTISGHTARFYAIGVTNSTNEVGVLPPKVHVIFSSPQEGATFVAGQPITLSLTVESAGAGISAVTLLDNGSLVETRTSPPWTKTLTVTEGPHNFVAIATAGTASASAKVAVTVTPHQAPTLGLVFPANGASFTNISELRLEAAASAYNGASIGQISFFDGGTLLGQGTWDHPSPGVHYLTARATDSYGASSQSPTNIVRILEIPAGNLVPPLVTLTGPTSGGKIAVGIPISLAATARPNGPGSIERVELYVNGSLAQTKSSPTDIDTYTFSWTPSAVQALDIIAKAYTPLDRSAESLPLFLTAIMPPMVALTSPAGENYDSGQNVRLEAQAFSSGTISNLMLYDNGALRASTNQNLLSADWYPAAGHHTLFARAVDAEGFRNCHETSVTSGHPRVSTHH